MKQKVKLNVHMSLYKLLFVNLFQPEGLVSFCDIPSKWVCCVSWKIITAGPKLHRGTSMWHLSVASFSSLVKCFRYASEASPRKVNMSVWSLSALVLYRIMSDIARTFNNSLVRWFWFPDMPNNPSVSKTMARLTSSYAAHTPTVQESWDDEVGNISWPSKNVWFRVCDFPSPVLPNMDTTFMPVSPLHESFVIKSLTVCTCQRRKRYIHLILLNTNNKICYKSDTKGDGLKKGQKSVWV